MTRIIITLLILLIIAFVGNPLVCQAAPRCDAGEVIIDVPNTYPGGVCGNICGTPQEKIWWENQNHIQLPQWSSWVLIIGMVFAVYFFVVALEWMMKKVLQRAH